MAKAPRVMLPVQYDPATDEWVTRAGRIGAGRLYRLKYPMHTLQWRRAVYHLAYAANRKRLDNSR